MRPGPIACAITAKASSAACRTLLLLSTNTGAIALVTSGRLKSELGNVSSAAMKTFTVSSRTLEFRCCKFDVNTVKTDFGERICISCMNTFMFSCLITILLSPNLLDSANSKGLRTGRMPTPNLATSNPII